MRQAALGWEGIATGLRGDVPYQRLLTARLQYLQGLGLAQPTQAGGYQLDSKMEETLRRLGERGDILRAMRRAMRGEVREFVINLARSCARPSWVASPARVWPTSCATGGIS